MSIALIVYYVSILRSLGKCAKLHLELMDNGCVTKLQLTAQLTLWLLVKRFLDAATLLCMD